MITVPVSISELRDIASAIKDFLDFEQLDEERFKVVDRFVTSYYNRPLTQNNDPWQSDEEAILKRSLGMGKRKVLQDELQLHGYHRSVESIQQHISYRGWADLYRSERQATLIRLSRLPSSDITDERAQAMGYTSARGLKRAMKTAKDKETGQ